MKNEKKQIKETELKHHAGTIDCRTACGECCTDCKDECVQECVTAQKHGGKSGEQLCGGCCDSCKGACLNKFS